MTIEHVSDLVVSAAFEEFVGIWQRLLMHLNCAVYGEAKNLLGDETEDHLRTDRRNAGLCGCGHALRVRGPTARAAHSSGEINRPASRFRGKGELDGNFG